MLRQWSKETMTMFLVDQELIALVDAGNISGGKLGPGDRPSESYQKDSPFTQLLDITIGEIRVPPDAFAGPQSTRESHRVIF